MYGDHLCQTVLLANFLPWPEELVNQVLSSPISLFLCGRFYCNRYRDTLALVLNMVCLYAMNS